jgi:hypothetical protein
MIVSVSKMESATAGANLAVTYIGRRV